jgi:hypothetical protein
MLKEQNAVSEKGNIKIDVSKIVVSDLKETSTTNKKSIYKGLEKMTSDEKKKFRSKIRRELRNYINDVLGKDRSNAEKVVAIENFLNFYKQYWIIQDFKIENFSEKKNPNDIAEIKKFLKNIRLALGKDGLY